MAPVIAPTALLVLLLNASLLAAPSQTALKPGLTGSTQAGAADRERRAETLYQQAVELVEARYYDLAHLRLFEAVQLWQQAQQTERAAQALLHLAEYDRRANRWQDALRCYRRALQLQALQGPTKAAALNSVAQLYVSLNQFHLAQEYYQQALSLARQIKDPLREAIALAGLAAVYVEQGLIAQARPHLEKAQRLAQQAGDDRTAAAIFSLAGRAYHAEGQKAEAREAVEQALALYRKTGDQEGEIKSLCWLSELDLASGQPQAALEQAAQAVKVAGALKASEAQWRAHLARARAQRALGRTDEAVKSYYRAYALIEKQRLAHFSADAFKVALLAERQAPYRELADLWMERGRADEAFYVIEHARARATLDLLASGQRREGPLGTPASSEALPALAERVTRLRAELRSLPPDDAQRAARQAELTEAEHRLEEARWEMERRKPFTSPATLAQAQKMLRPGDVLLEFFLGEQRSYVWLISSDEASWAALPGQQEIEEKVRPYLAAIATKPHGLYLEREVTRLQSSGDELFRLLLGQLAERLKSGQRLVIAPDGLLYYLPFETLIHDGRYLIESHTISYVPSASVLGLLQRSNGALDSQGQMELLAFGDPVFGPPLKTKGVQRRGGKADDVRREFWSASSFRFPPLPNTRTEVLAISELFPPERRSLYLGATMTEEALKREPLDRYARLHFATHSLIDERLPARSGVVLTLGKGAEEDGFLEVAEITELRLDCDLVVLSACQTGRGQLARGEGVVGLARAFLYAGSRAVTVSLWSVSDLSTSRFMTSFYRHLAAKLDPAAALRQAKLELLESQKAERHPYYWAPFVLVGNPQRAVISSAYFNQVGIVGEHD